eukprot:TRINITY_DN23359_c0_g1_i1.p1 TRINITY_DN23359_c0_g1~~TRINITY_DN23359_c0_g1_i1.p1  ORF type:complete len:165 (+),score=31.32 TRINITY_DN23359_c0_g1_i1:380-874(+)
MSFQHVSSQQQQPQQFVKVIDLRPAPTNTVNIVFIILEIGAPQREHGSGALAATALVADGSAAVHLHLWGPELEWFQSGDIIRLTNGIFAFLNKSMVLRAGKKGQLEKIGDFAMVFNESLNMSRLPWVQDPLNPKLFVPKFPSPPGVPPNFAHGPGGLPPGGPR